MKIIGIDLGNYYTKTSKGISFISKVSEIPNILVNKPIQVNDKIMYLEEGEFDTEPRKAYKKNLLFLLKGAVQMSSYDKHNKVVLGLPLSQYKQDKEYLINRVLQSGIVEDVEVEPEGIVSLPQNFSGVVCDIGGGTTDICLVVKEGERKRVKNPYSLPYGIHKLESEFINQINSMYGLDLQSCDADRIITNGLFVYGEQKPFKMDVYKEFVNTVINRIQTDYSVKTNNFIILGGGAIKLYTAFKNRVPQCQLLTNSFYANANAFEKIGKEIWK